MFVYQVYGIRLASNRILPGVMPAASPGPADVTFDLAGEVDGLAQSADSGHSDWVIARTSVSDLESVSEVSTRISEAGAFYRLRYALEQAVLEYVIDPLGRHVRATWTAPAVVEDAVSTFLGPVLGFVQRLRGVTCLHASVVAVDSQALALVGQKGRGKSTLAGVFARDGYPILSDDLAPLTEVDGRFWVEPGYPRLRLWPEAVTALDVIADHLPRVASIADKRYVDLASDGGAADWTFQNQPLPLGAIYILQRANPIRSEFAVFATNGQSRLLHLTSHSPSSFVMDPRLRAEHFSRMGRLAKAVPVRLVLRPYGIDTLPDLAALILQDFRNSAN